MARQQNPMQQIRAALAAPLPHPLLDRLEAALGPEKVRFVSKILFYLALLLMFLGYILWQPVTIPELVAMGLLLVRILGFQRYTRGQALMVLAAVGVAAACAVSSGNVRFAILCMLACGCQGISFKKAVGLYVPVLAAALMGPFLMACLGLAPMTGQFPREGTLLLAGYVNPNGLAAVILGLSLVVAYLRWDRQTHADRIALVAVAAFVLLACGSRAVGACLLLAAVAKPLANRFAKDAVDLLPWVIPCCAAIGALFAMGYTEGGIISDFLDGLFSHRLSKGHTYYQHFGLTLFGQPALIETVMDTTSDSFPLDCAYIQLFVRFGLLSWVLFGWAYLKAGQTAARKGDLGLVCIIAIFGIYGMMEGYVLSVAINFTLLAATLLWEPQTSDVEASRAAGAAVPAGSATPAGAAAPAGSATPAGSAAPVGTPNPSAPEEVTL